MHQVAVDPGHSQRYLERFSAMARDDRNAVFGMNERITDSAKEWPPGCCDVFGDTRGLSFGQKY